MLASWIVPFVSLLASHVSAQDYCTYFGHPEWYCDTCPYQGDQPIQCEPYNATFDDLKANQQVGNYDSATWTNFVVEDLEGHPFAPNVIPNSAPNVARLPAGKSGFLSFNQVGSDGYETYSGFIYHTNYACATHVGPRANAVPTPCNITISALCGSEITSYYYPYATHNFTLTYTPKYLKGGKAQMANSTGYLNSGGYCSEYNFTAVSARGRPVDVLLDSVWIGYEQYDSNL